MKTKLTFALVAALTSTAFAAFQAPLPEFKNEKQLAEWRAEKASESASQGYATEQPAFYTGKPYLASSDGYAFKFRSYNPELARWTSDDPSGFPDGANASIYGINNPISGFDPNGLAWKLQLVGSSSVTTGNSGTVDMGLWTGTHDMTTSAHLATTNISVNSSAQEGTVQGEALGNILDFATTLQATWTISVDGDGQISISASGQWNTIDRDLSAGANWSEKIGKHSASLTFHSSVKHQGTGLTGAGVAGLSLSWSGGNGDPVSASTTLRFRAVE